MTPLATGLDVFQMTSAYSTAFAAIVFWWVIAIIAPFAVLVVFLIWLWASAFWCNQARLVANTLSWFFLLGSSTFSYAFKIRPLSAKLD